VIGRADRWIKRTTIGSVGMLALIAGTVSYLHMHLLVELHGQPGWVAALTPLSVDGMIVAASTTLLAESRSGERGGLLPWVLLAFGSVASLAANVAVAEPTATGRVIAAWPSFALIGSYELLMRQIRDGASTWPASRSARRPATVSARSPAADQPRRGSSARRSGVGKSGTGLKRQAWEWAVEYRDAHGGLPSGKVIADQFGRHERWGRLVKRDGLAGQVDQMRETRPPAVLS
jgi:Protein of unknown function (DUF2637)